MVKNTGNSKNAAIAKGMPLKPKASFQNLRNIDKQLSIILGNFWGMVWGRVNPAIDKKTKIGR